MHHVFHCAVTSPSEPAGSQDAQTRHGTLLALCALECVLYCNLAVLEQPRSSIRRGLTEWIALLAMLRVHETWTSSCAFGSPRQKQFRFLSAGINLARIHRPCTCARKHLPVRGRCAKSSATYNPGLTSSLAPSGPLRAVGEADVDVSGLERTAVTSLALSPWGLDHVWTWPRHVLGILCRMSRTCVTPTLPCRRLALLSGLRHVCRRAACTGL